jgi:hypothetical protein
MKKIFKNLILTINFVMLSNQIIFGYGISGSIAKPSGAIDVTQAPYNVPNNRTGNASSGIQQALNEYGGTKPIWIPAGSYRLATRINITKNNTKLYMHREAKTYREHTSFGMIHAYKKYDILIKGGRFYRNGQNAKRLFENYLFYPISVLSEEFNPQNTMGGLSVLAKGRQENPPTNQYTHKRNQT